ncbi:hypothetical protein FACS1894151_10280 [Spirochaetia bacterium]|nr:hypothetical protein FACS1894151_10280 [Spirochaetia bacterium]
MAGPVVISSAREKGRTIIPVDSEHQAIFHLINAHGREKLDTVLLTASGGPFRKKTTAELADITPEEALRHPTWSMGPKITIDSASLANKGLEVIEASLLFGLEAEKISVVIHPQSIVHSMIRLTNGAVYAQLSKPDMRQPIHDALYYPDCVPCPFGRLDFDALTLEFEKPDFDTFPMLSLAYDAVKSGSVYPAVYNAANEIAVDAFLKKRSRFVDIPFIVSYVLNKEIWNHFSMDIESILEADREARLSAEHFIAEKRTERGSK